MSPLTARPGARTVRTLGGTLLLAASIGLASCAHHPGLAPNGPAQRMQADASRVGPVQYEDDFVEGRLVMQALPLGSPERAPMRAKLNTYLLGPMKGLPADKLRQEATELGNTDVFDRIYDSLRDATNLYEPQELWATPLAIPLPERDLLAATSRLVVGLFGPRGAETPTALALNVLATLEPQSREWNDQIDKLLAWMDEAGAAGEGGARRNMPAVDLLESVLGDWPTPAVADRLAGLLTDRRQKFASILGKPLPGSDDARRALGDLLISQGDEMQRAVPNVAATYLRCGRLDRAAAAIAPLAGKSGDEPELRALINAALPPNGGPGPMLALARRFLPRVAPLGGTAPAAPDQGVAYRRLLVALERNPDDVETLMLSAELAKLVAAPFLAIRELEEAQQLLERAGKGQSDLTARISSELLGLYFLRLRLALDPERAAPVAADQAERLRQQASDTRRRFQGTELHVSEGQIDFELGRSYVNAGLLDRAEPLLERARGAEPENKAEVTADLAGLFMTRGQPQEAPRLLQQSLDSMQATRGARETIGGVEGESRLERLLGDTLNLTGAHNEAENAWHKTEEDM